MQQILILLVVVVLSTTYATFQDQNMQPLGENRIGSIDGWRRYPVNNYMTNKRAINGQLRRSSILWGKRSQEWDGYRDIEEMPVWTENNQKSLGQKENAIPEFSDDYKTSFASPTQPNTVQDNTKIKRVAKDGIRPKLALSSRLWGRR